MAFTSCSPTCLNLGPFVVTKIDHTLKASPLGAFVCLLMNNIYTSYFSTNLKLSHCVF
jgi:hypothetical protein